MRYRYIRTTLLTCGAILLSLWAGMPPQALAQNYGGGGMGTSTLSVTPQDLAVQQGGAASAKVSVKLASGGAWGTNLQATRVPAGVTVSFDPASGDPPFTSAMTVKAASSAKVGTYTMGIQATGDDPSPAVQYAVKVTAAGY